MHSTTFTLVSGDIILTNDGNNINNINSIMGIIAKIAKIINIINKTSFISSFVVMISYLVLLQTVHLFDPFFIGVWTRMVYPYVLS